MKKDKPLIEDIDLFHAAMNDVTPLTTENRIQKSKSFVVSLNPLRQQDFDEHTLPPRNSREPVNANTSLFFKHAGVQDRVMQELSKGKYRIEDQLDLHGLIETTAEKKLCSFIQEAYQQGKKTILIIHGKGFGSNSEEPLLKNRVNQLLPSLYPVLAYCSALPKDGGTGAVYVRLRTCNVDRH